MIGVVVGLNCLIAVLVCWMAAGLWRWRRGIRELTRELQGQVNGVSVGQQAGYALMQRRSQIAETRMTVALWQLKLRQARQTIQLLKTLRTLLLYRSTLSPFSRRSKKHK